MSQIRFIFIGSYVGENVSGSHRQERFIRRCLQQNIKVTLLKPSGNLNGRWDFDSLNDFDKWKLLHKPSNFRTSVSSSLGKKYLIILKHLFFIDIIGRGFFATIWLILYNNKLFVKDYFLLVSSPSFSSVVSVYLCSLIPNKSLRFSIDMRDAWANHKSINIFRRVRNYIESKVLKRAENVITVSKYLAEEFELNYSIRVDVIYNVNRSIQVLPKLNRRSNNKILRFSYFGSLPMNFYDLNIFCKGISELLSVNSQFVDSFLFSFYGACDELKDCLVFYPEIRDYFLFFPSVSHDEALVLMLDCDAVLFLGFNAEKNAGVVSTKIFEYFYLKVKILPFGIRKDSDLDWLFMNCCGKSVYLNSSADFSNYLFLILGDLEILPCCINDDLLFELDRTYDIFINRNLK